MQRKDYLNNQERNREKSGFARNLLGEPTPAKSSGFAFSLAVILPVAVSLLFLVFVVALVGKNAENEEWYAYANFLLPQLCFAIVLFCFLKYKGVSLKSAVLSQKCEKKYYLVAVILQFGLFCLSELNGLFLEFLKNFGYQDNGIILPSMDGFGFVGVLVTVALMPAIFEECIFRGAILGGLRAFGKTGAVLVCGTLFALYHQNPAQTLYQFCCGVAFALVALRAESILPTVLAHFINNAVILTLTKLGIVSFAPWLSVVLLITSSLALIGSIVYLTVFDKKEKVERAETQEKSERKYFFVYASIGIAVCVFTWFAVLLTGM